MSNLNWKYLLLLALIAINLFMAYGVLSIFTIDRYALFMSMFIDVPLGLLSFGISLLVWRKEKNKTTVRRRILIAGMVIGAVVSVLSPILFLIVKP